MSEPQSLADQIQEIAQDAVGFARQYIGADLDFSPESLEVVEAQLDSIARSLPKGFVRRLLRGPSGFANDVLRPTLLWGSYVGEVIRRHWSGEWRMDNTAPDVDVYVLGLEHDDIRPMGKVSKRLQDGSQNDIDNTTGASPISASTASFPTTARSSCEGRRKLPLVWEGSAHASSPLWVLPLRCQAHCLPE